MYEKPDDGSKIVASIKPGTIADSKGPILASGSNPEGWQKISSAGKTGWCHAESLLSDQIDINDFTYGKKLAGI
jgi:hypothetical protein